VAGYRLGLIKEMVPGVSKVAHVLNGRNPGNIESKATVVDAAAKLGLTVLSVPVNGPDDLDRAFVRIVAEKAGALSVNADGMLVAHRRRLADLAAKHRLPAFYALREHAEAGGLLAYSADWVDLVQRSATCLGRSLVGTLA
jgi:putative ABC transport system substrate-binding protein